MSTLKTYSYQITDYIKQCLLNGQLKPGDKVNEVYLAATLNISRAPVREALQMLVNDGLIVYIPQRGKFIKALSPAEIRDSYFIGGVLEGAAVAENIHQFTTHDLQKLYDIVEQMKNIDTVTDHTAKFMELDVTFHDLLLSYSTSSFIVEHSRNICQRVSKFLLVRQWPLCFSIEEIAERHSRIVDALRTKDKYTVECALREHYASLGERMAKYGCAQPPYEHSRNT